jgi:hypothetical protein
VQDSRRRRRAAAHGQRRGKRLAEGRLNASGSTVLLGEVLRSWRRGQHGLRCASGQQLLGGRLTGCDGSGPNPASTRAEDANRGSGVDPVLGAELLQWSRAEGMQWIDRPTAEPKLGAAERIAHTGPVRNWLGWGGLPEKGEARSLAGVQARVRRREAAPGCSGPGPWSAMGGRAGGERNK